MWVAHDGGILSVAGVQVPKAVCRAIFDKPLCQVEIQPLVVIHDKWARERIGTILQTALVGHYRWRGIIFLDGKDLDHSPGLPSECLACPRVGYCAFFTPNRPYNVVVVNSYRGLGEWKSAQKPIPEEFFRS